jgi:hypothetical protein
LIQRGLQMRTVLIIAAVLAVVSSTAAAQGLYRTYAQWAGMSVSERAAYIAGAVDSIVSVVSGDNDAKMSVHYSECLLRSKMSNTQLAASVLRFAESRPALHAGSVQAALLQYLVEVCGAPPKG